MAIPSLALIPTGFKDGKLYSVLPESGAGDFDVVRGSGATRVNKDGLIEDVRILSGELITNGGFDTDSDWGLGTNWNISGGSLNASASTATAFQTGTGVTTNKTYKVTYTISNYVSGSVRIEIGSANVSVGIIRSADGTYTEYITALGDSAVYFDGISAFTGSIDNVSVKEVTEDTDIPRLDYTGGGCPALLVEPQSTNLIPYSEDFSDASWIENQTTITQNATISPSGLIDASMISEDNTNNFHRVRRAISPAANSTLSIFAKKGTNDKFLLWTGASGVGFDLTLGTINNVSGLNPSSGSSIKDFGNGWYRCSITDNSISAFEVFSLQDFSGFTYQGSSTNNFYVYGAQLEELPYATSYIPTSGVIATRLSDSVTGAGDTTTFNSTEGVLYAEIASLSTTGSNSNITLSDGTGNNRIYIYYLIDNSISVIYNINSTGASLNDFALANITDQTKIAVRWGNSNVSVWINGTSVLSNTTSNFLSNTLNALSFAKPTGGGDFTGRVKDLRVYNTALTDAELLTLTTI